MAPKVCMDVVGTYKRARCLKLAMSGRSQDEPFWRHSRRLGPLGKTWFFGPLSVHHSRLGRWSIFYGSLEVAHLMKRWCGR